MPDTPLIIPQLGDLYRAASPLAEALLRVVVGLALVPHGLRFVIFRIITLGRADTNYELVLVQGLANLKEAVEGADAGSTPDPVP